MQNNTASIVVKHKGDVRMNIMIINHYAGSDKYGMEFRPYYMGRELVKQGHDVTVIAADCSHLRKENPQIEKSFTEEYIDGVRYVFVKTVKYKRNNLKRLFNVVGFLSKLRMNSRKIYQKYKPDVIIASSTYPYDMKAAKSIAKYNIDVRVCFEIHDIWPMSLIEIYKLSPKNPAMQHIQKAEIYAYENADCIISILPHVNRHIDELGFHNVNYVYIPNGVVLGEENEEDTNLEIKEHIQKLHDNHKFVVMYLGGFSKANALDDLMESHKYLDSNIHIVMVGDGPLKEVYQKMIHENKIDNISLLPCVKKTQVNATLQLADALYIGAKKTPLYKYGVGMNKIFDYMLSKRPIIYGIEASNDVVAEAGCGITIKPENPRAIAEGAKDLSERMSEELVLMGEKGYQYVCKNHDYEKLAKRLAIVLQ